MSEKTRRRVGLDDCTAFGARRIEIGSGNRPQTGYIHVDVDPRAPHVEVVTPAWNLPFRDGWADEILAIHSLEHIHPRRLLATLAEWHRVMKPEGTLRLHVPNIRQLLERYLSGPPDEKWALMGAILGMGNAPTAAGPGDLMWNSDHQILFDADLLRRSLEAAGFESIIDLTEQMTDVHVDAWRDLVPRFSLIFEARKGLGA